jgi:hypothetical protein
MREPIPMQELPKAAIFQPGGIKKGHPKVAFKKLERFFTYTAATGRM